MGHVLSRSPQVSKLLINSTVYIVLDGISQHGNEIVGSSWVCVWWLFFWRIFFKSFEDFKSCNAANFGSCFAIERPQSFEHSVIRPCVSTSPGAPFDASTRR